MTDEPIPDDIMQAARKVCAPSFSGASRIDDAQHVLDVARALMAERAKWEAEIGSIRRAYAELMRQVQQGETYKENATLRAENERLREALIPIAKASESYGPGYADYDSGLVRVGILRRARAALKGGE